MAMLVMNFELGTGHSMTAASINCFFDWMESDDDRRHFSRRLFSRKDEFDEEMVYEILLGLSRVVRKPYGTVAHLLLLAADRWRAFDGWCAGRRVEPLHLRPDRAHQSHLRWATGQARDIEVDAEAIQAFDEALLSPLPSQRRNDKPRRPTQAEADAEGAAFAAFHAQVVGG